MNEPDYEAACGWWSDLPQIWTPVGWKDHLFRFNLFWSGMLLARPDVNARTKPWAGRGVQIGFIPSRDGRTPSDWPRMQEDDRVVQGWEDSPAPVLWSEWAHEGLLLRQYVFAHAAGGGEVKTGVEPLFAWVRLAVHDLCPALPLEPRTGFVLRLNAPHVVVTMNKRNNVLFRPENSRYPRRLRPERAEYRPSRGWRLLEKGGKVRLGIAPGQRCSVAFTPPKRGGKDADLFIQMDAVKGRCVDLLVPMLPTEPGVFDRELALGRRAALRQANRFWSRRPSTAARFETPERPVNETIRHALRFAEVLAETNAKTRERCMISGSIAYANLWASPGAMAAVMLLDAMGHHSTAGKYIEIFRAQQGTVTPPGDAYRPHPGYLSTPPEYKSIDWLSDHGAILWMIGMHALLSGDREFARRFADTVIKACEWIRDARAITGHGGCEGVLPAGRASDRASRIQAVWSDGWNYKGLSAAVRLLRQIGHPRAEEFAREARDYRRAFARAFRRKCSAAPTWTDARGRRRPLVPTSLSAERLSDMRHPFYLDTGPLFLVFSGLLPAKDPAMRAALMWFRDGPPRRFSRWDSQWNHIPFLAREISSCEPCYSWNLLHSHQLGDREKFLEGMYSLFAGAISRKTFIGCESRGGMSGTVFPTPMAAWIARLAVVDDEWREGELHLLRLMPAAWLAEGRTAVFEKMPTVFGPVTLRTRRHGGRLDVLIRSKFRAPPKKLILHLPQAEGIRQVTVNGRRVRPGQRTLDLTR